MKALLFVLALVAVALANEQHEMFREAVQRSQANGGNTWVILIAGSRGWLNYRHQSSVYKSYQLAHQAGVPDERIITFFEDDIANSKSNPFPGKVYNELYDKSGSNIDVYAGVVKDYIAENATVANLMAVLSGETPRSGSGKVLKSTANDNIFVFYDDHGATHLICMPREEYFHNYQLAQCLEAMQKKKMFNKLIFFMSACYSGSMWYNQTLPANVYIASSAPTSASSYACLQDPVLKTYVTSCWPHGWIESVVTHGLKVDFGTMFEDSYHYAKEKSPTEPCQYGDINLKTETFLGYMKNANVEASTSGKMIIDKDETAVPQYLVPYSIAKLNYELKPTEYNLRVLKSESEIRFRIDSMVTEISKMAMPDNKFLGTSLCQTCDESCECFATCRKIGSVDHCERYCCDYAACKANSHQNSREIECSLTLQNAFSNAFTGSLKNHPYLLSAGSQFNRLCRSGVDVDVALKAIKTVCH